MRSIFKTSLIACAALVTASSAFAQKAGDNIYSIGFASINPDVSLGKITSTSPTFQGALTNATANVGSKTAVSMSWLHMFDNNFGAEFTIGIPAEFAQDLTTPATNATHSAAARMKIWTPTAVGKYFFGTANDTWRPYLGFGVSRVSFHNVEINRNDSTVLAMAGTSAAFSSSWAPVYSAGAVYNIDDKWSINGSVSYLPIKTTATFVGSGAVTTGDAKLNTTDYVIRLGYRF
jgi:outer membrane protein